MAATKASGRGGEIRDRVPSKITAPEITDPINYAPYWFHKQPWWDAHPISVYQTEGLEDEHTPPISTEALSAAAKSPIIDVPLQWRPGHEIHNLFEDTLPLQGNVLG